MDLLIDAVRTPTSRAELRLADREAYLGGGTWLYSEPQPGLTGLVDLAAMRWAPLERTAAGLSIAATCTIAQLARAATPDAWRARALVVDCCHALLASFKVWNVATVGGNVCASLPAGAMISLATALDGVAVVWTPDGSERHQPVAELVTGPGQNTLAHGEVLRAVDLPEHALRARTAFRKTALSPLGRSAAVVAGRADEDGAVTISVTAATPRPLLLRFAGLPPAGELADALAAVEEWFDDVHGAADWRAHVTRVLAEEVRAELGAGSRAAPPSWPRATEPVRGAGRG